MTIQEKQYLKKQEQLLQVFYKEFFSWKSVNFYEKLKYLPVTLRGIRIFRFKKLTVFCLKMFAVFLAGQLFFSLVIYHEIIWGNIWYPVVFGFLVPYGANGIDCRFFK